MAEVKEIRFNLPPSPPDSIFKYRVNRQNPAHDQWGKEQPDGTGGTLSFIPLGFEYLKKTPRGYLQTIHWGGDEEREIELTDEEFKKMGVKTGNFVHWFGCMYSSKTIRPVEAIYAMIPIKRRFIDMIELVASKESLLPVLGFLFTSKKKKISFLNKALEHFNTEADMTAMPWYLEGYYCDVVQEIQNFASVFLAEIGIRDEIARKTAEIIGMMFEYDNAYLFRINDVLNEANKEALLKNFPKEINRLLELERSRDHNGESNSVANKFKKGAFLLKLAWWLPRLRKAIRKAIQAMDLDNCRLSKGDIYHTLLYSNYDTGGIGLPERHALFVGMHGPDNRPMQILIRNK